MWNFWVYYAAYSTDEIDEKTKALRASANLSVAEDAPAVEVSISWVLCPLKNWVASPFNYLKKKKIWLASPFACGCVRLDACAYEVVGF